MPGAAPALAAPTSAGGCHCVSGSVRLATMPAVVTLLFTDLVGSTEMLDRLGDDGAESLRRTHFRILREAVAGAGGVEVKNLGDRQHHRLLAATGVAGSP